MSGQLHARADLVPVSTGWVAGWSPELVWKRCQKRKIIASNSNRTPVFHPQCGSLRPLTGISQQPAGRKTQVSRWQAFRREGMKIGPWQYLATRSCQGKLLNLWSLHQTPGKLTCDHYGTIFHLPAHLIVRSGSDSWIYSANFDPCQLGFGVQLALEKYEP